jgi:hypothetical protein
MVGRHLWRSLNEWDSDIQGGEWYPFGAAIPGAVGLAAAATDASGFGIVGFAADDATGDTDIREFMWLPDVILLETRLVRRVSQTAAVDLGQQFVPDPLRRTYVDKYKTTASNAMCRVIGLHKQDDHPCFYGKVYFTVLVPSCQLLNAWNTNTSYPLALNL